MKLRIGNYEVVKLYSEKENLFINEFFPPTNGLKRLVDKASLLSAYKSDGYLIIATMRVDKETYINLRINDTVNDYCELDKSEQEYRAKYKKGEMSRDAYIDAMKGVQDYKWTLLKKLDMQIRRLNREELDCYNELALQLYDQFLKGIM